MFVLSISRKSDPVSDFFLTFAPHFDKKGQRAIETLTTLDDTNALASADMQLRKRAAARV